METFPVVRELVVWFEVNPKLAAVRVQYWRLSVSTVAFNAAPGVVHAFTDSQIEAWTMAEVKQLMKWKAHVVIWWDSDLPQAVHLWWERLGIPVRDYKKMYVIKNTSRKNEYLSFLSFDLLNK